MASIVRLQNISESAIALVDASGNTACVVPAFGYASLTYERYIALSVQNDLNEMALKAYISQDMTTKVSAKDFGAIGDGIADDTQALQDAIDYVVSCGGGVVSIPVGVYVSNMLDVDGNVILQGDSQEDSVIKMLGSIGISFSDSDGGMDGIMIICPKSNEGATGATGVSVASSNPLTISRCSFVGMNTCLDVENSRVLVDNCYMEPVFDSDGDRFFVVVDDDSTFMESLCSYK